MIKRTNYLVITSEMSGRDIVIANTILFQRMFVPPFNLLYCHSSLDGELIVLIRGFERGRSVEFKFVFFCRL